MDTTKHHWEILRRVPDELARKVRDFMVIGWLGKGVVLATEDGEGYWMGEMEFVEESKQAMEPTRLDVPNLASMAQGYSLILLLCENGQIYTMGKNCGGVMGLGTEDEDTYFSPQLISSPHKFISVRSALSHSLALTEDGKVWSWGFNFYGPVGVPGTFDCFLSSRVPSSRVPSSRVPSSRVPFSRVPSSRVPSSNLTSICLPSLYFPSPCQILVLETHRIVAVECGSMHSLALTDQGEAYAWGWNDWGQLGNGTKSSTHIPTRIPTPSPVRSMAAGCYHTLLLTQTGEVYACGGNGHGQLGLPTTTESSASLIKVAGLPLISQIASHFYSDLSIAISPDRKCFAWGKLIDIATPTPLQLPPTYSTLDSVLSFYSFPVNTPCSVRVERPRMSMERSDPSTTQTESLTEP